MLDRPIRVLVIDDSAFARKVVREVLSRSSSLLVVGTARDGLDALERIAELRPDVVTLDLVMPNLDGLGVMRALQTLAWQPAVVVVSTAGEDSEIGVEAHELGAFDVVTKPTALATERLYGLETALPAVVAAAARWPKVRLGTRPSLPPRIPSGSVRATQTRILLIGASTGGPQALGSLIRALPPAFPVPVALVLHMPPGYTDAFARRINDDSALEVTEAREGLTLRAGLVVVARAGLHLTIVADGIDWRCKLDVVPLDTQHRPAVDVLFESGAETVGAGVLGVVLTGMGNDGLRGSQAIRAAGGRVLTEAESSCVVYGMPRSVFEAGLANAEAPIEGMASLILDYL